MSVLDSRAVPARASSHAPPRLAWRLLLCVTLLPVPLWLVAAQLTDPGPRWQSRYYPNRGLSGTPTQLRERRVSRYWSQQRPLVPGGHDVRKFSARFDTCLVVEHARDVPFMLVARGRARFFVDDDAALATAGLKRRASRGEVIHLEPGVHHLRVELEPVSWGAIALLASFDGDVPRPLEGARLRLPLASPTPCRP